MVSCSDFIFDVIKIVIVVRIITFGTNRVTRYILWKHGRRLLSGDINQPSNDKHTVRTKSFMKRYVPITIGIGLLGFYVTRRIQPKNRKPGAKASNWEIKIYSLLPLRFFSRVWGTMSSIDLPVFLRPKIYSIYANSFGVNLEECQIQDLTSYRNLSEFFIRPIREDCRPIDHDCKCIVSPADGKILTFGKVTSCQVEQVKGVTYSLPQFLGKQSWEAKNSTCKRLKMNSRITPEGSQTVLRSNSEKGGEENNDEDDDDLYQDYSFGKKEQGLKALNHSCDDENIDSNLSSDNIYIQRLKQKEETELYQCVVYLAPGDYHRFHSPVSWKVFFRRHFQGKLLSVNPAIASFIGNLFSLNERAVYIGSWFHGFFSLTAVGATNVGSIRVLFDPSLRTNQWKNTPNVRDCYFNKDCKDENNVDIAKGELFGEFRLGSTIVLIFEAPKNFRFNVETGQKVKYGQKIGVCC